jgi:hypothetical protein
MGANQSIDIHPSSEKGKSSPSQALSQTRDAQRLLKDTSWIWVQDAQRAEPNGAVSEKTPTDVSKTRKPEALSLPMTSEWQNTLLKDPKARCAYLGSLEALIFFNVDC